MILGAKRKSKSASTPWHGKFHFPVTTMSVLNWEDFVATFLGCDSSFKQLGACYKCILLTLLHLMSLEDSLFSQNMKVHSRRFLQLDKSHNCFLTHRNWMTFHVAYYDHQRRH